MADKVYLNKRQQAERLGITTRSLERYCARESFPFIRLGGRVLFDPELTGAYLTQRTSNAQAIIASKQPAGS